MQRPAPGSLHSAMPGIASSSKTSGARPLHPSGYDVGLSTFPVFPVSLNHYCLVGTVCWSPDMLGATTWVSSAYPWAPIAAYPGPMGYNITSAAASPDCRHCAGSRERVCTHTWCPRESTSSFHIPPNTVTRMRDRGQPYMMPLRHHWPGHPATLTALVHGLQHPANRRGQAQLRRYLEDNCWGIEVEALLVIYTHPRQHPSLWAEELQQQPGHLGSIQRPERWAEPKGQGVLRILARRSPPLRAGPPTGGRPPRGPSAAWYSGGPSSQPWR